VAVHEACQVWIEQRIKEELDSGDERSLREIGRVIAAEIEKMFEAKVNPRAVEKRAERMIATNVAPSESLDAPTVKHGDTGDILREVERKVRAGKSIREAAGEVADSIGKNPETVRKAYTREAEKVGDPAKASQAMNIVGYAISQLERLTKSDPKWEDAINKLESWITRFKEQGE
jgi:hypothetical protein